MSLLNDASLVMIPSGYKDTKLYSVKPTDGSGDFTFSRGSNLAATRVNSEGLIEKGRENLLLQSNTFDTTWSTTDASVTGGQSGYDGTSDAWLFTASATSNCRVNQSVSGSGVQSISIYAKANTSNFLAINVIVSGTNALAYFDLSSGVVGTTNSAVIDANIESIGGGWYRCFVVYNDTNTQMRFIIADGDGSTDVTNGNSIYIQDAQLEVGLVATDYIETTTTTAQAGILEDMPRLDYSGGASCPSLLLEPQRSNIIQSTEYIADGVYGYTLANAPTFTSGITSPSNEANAYNVTDFVAANTRLDCDTSVSAASAGTHTYSAYYKGSGSINIALNTTIGGGSGGNEKTITLTDEWVRHEITHTFDATDGGNIRVHIAITRTANNTASVDIAFPQVEAGSYPTSYIPTHGSSVTRSGDSCSKTGIASILNNSEGTLFLEMQGISDGGNSRRFTISDGSTANRVSIEYDETAGSIKSFYSGQGTLNGTLSATGLTQTDNHKVALVYNSSVFKMFIDGVLKGTDITITSLPVGLDVIEFANGANALPIEGRVKETIYFPTALTDAECIELTTL